jgi:hypothetical protein
MVYVFVITIVPDVAVRANLFQYYRLAWFAQGQNQQNLISLWNIKDLPEPVPVNGTDHTATQPPLRRAQHDRLGRDAVVAPEGIADLFIPKDDDVG